MRSLRRLGALTLMGTAILLAALVLTGLRHNSLDQDYRAIVQESEATIFFYTTIQDQIVLGLISADQSALLGAAKELEQLQSRCVALLDNPLIPAEYKLFFLKELDFGGMIVNLRNLADKPAQNELLLQITGQLRLLNKQFLQFDRIVVNNMRNRVMEYQKIALILMGMIIFLVCYSLIILHLHAVKPLVNLARATEKAVADRSSLHLGKGGGKSFEINNVVAAFNLLMERLATREPDDLPYYKREAEFSAIINEATNQLNGIINYAQLLADSSDLESAGSKQGEVIEKIIESGEQCAVILRKGIQ